MGKSINRTKKKVKKRIRRMGLFVAIISIVVIILGGRFYRCIYSNNVVLTDVETPYLKIPNGITFSELKEIIKESGVIKDFQSFIWVAQKKNYPNNIKGGRYKLREGMSNNELINMLRAGLQEPVNVTFNNVRKLNQLASVISKQLMVDSVELVELFNDSRFISELGFNRNTFPALFIPNTYQMYWNTDAKGFVYKMKKEYDKFWTKARVERAQEIGLSQTEVSILASIVDEETIMSDEKPVVAGLYLNRLNRNMRLQADPTVKFALGDFTVKRILNRDLEIDSPYNTYRYAGLPPGPIRIPSITGIKAVLNKKDHRYLYMCAKDDFSGYHNFARSLSQHNQNARKYQNALRRKGIMR